MKSMKKAITDEDRLNILSKAATKFATELKKMQTELENLDIPLKLYGNYGAQMALASARLSFVISELHGLARDCRPIEEKAPVL